MDKDFEFKKPAIPPKKPGISSSSTTSGADVGSSKEPGKEGDSSQRLGKRKRDPIDVVRTHYTEPKRKRPRRETDQGDNLIGERIGLVSPELARVEQH